MKNKTVLLVFILSLAFLKGFSQNTDAFFTEADAFLSSFVKDGKVDYAAIHKNPERLSNLLDQASQIKVSTSNPSEYKAFWINAYNLSTIKGIVDVYPIASPLDKKGFFDSKKYELGGTSITLNDIENKKLRGNFDEPRFHFVLVCGAIGCPPLISEAYVPSKLESQLQQQTVKALNNHGFIKVSKNKVAFSEIFKWYKEDFVSKGRTEIDFLNTFRKEKVPENLKVTYYSYDWRLNSI